MANAGPSIWPGRVKVPSRPVSVTAPNGQRDASLFTYEQKTQLL